MTILDPCISAGEPRGEYPPFDLVGILLQHSLFFMYVGILVSFPTFTFFSKGRRVEHLGDGLRRRTACGKGGSVGQYMKYSFRSQFPSKY